MAAGRKTDIQPRPCVWGSRPLQIFSENAARHSQRTHSALTTTEISAGVCESVMQLTQVRASMSILEPSSLRTRPAIGIFRRRFGPDFDRGGWRWKPRGIEPSKLLVNTVLY